MVVARCGVLGSVTHGDMWLKLVAGGESGDSSSVLSCVRLACVKCGSRRWIFSAAGWTLKVAGAIVTLIRKVGRACDLEIHNSNGTIQTIDIDIHSL